MRESRSSGSVEGVVGNHDSYSDFRRFQPDARRRTLVRPHSLDTLLRLCCRDCCTEVRVEELRTLPPFPRPFHRKASSLSGDVVQPVNGFMIFGYEA